MQNFLLYATVLLSSCSNLGMVHGTNDGCNEFVCGSVVSKCLLTQSCQCKLSDCHCCKDCLNCLGDFYTECCNCLDMCPKHNETHSTLALKSQIGDFEGVEELFDTLTAGDDEEQWTALRFPMRTHLKPHYDMSTSSLDFGSDGSEAASDDIDLHTFQQRIAYCTVIYLNSCIPNERCAKYCESMGANSYRWFHDGCCECVGANCFNYGINESRCTACPEEEEDELDDMVDKDYRDDSEDVQIMWDYGEDEINYN